MNFYQTLTAAINDIIAHGYDSQARVDYWIRQVREAAVRSLTPTHVLEQSLRNLLTTTYQRYVEKGRILQFHPGVSIFDINRVKPQLRGALDRAILANANLIVLDREASIERSIKRLNGWATSIPIGGTKAADRAEIKESIKKPLAQLPFEERRVIIDQGHKFISSLNNIIATDGGAIAMRWSSRWREPGYDYRVDHKDRDGKVYCIRGSWAHTRGLINKGAGYTDEITAPAEEPFCRCAGVYYTNLSDLPPEMLTQKGRDEEKRAEELIANL